MKTQSSECREAFWPGSVVTKALPQPLKLLLMLSIGGSLMLGPIMTRADLVEYQVLVDDHRRPLPGEPPTPSPQKPWRDTLRRALRTAQRPSLQSTGHRRFRRKRPTPRRRSVFTPEDIDAPNVSVASKRREATDTSG
jgi:hypothetical protein